MIINSADPRVNRFLGEVHRDGGVGLEYETADGGSGVVWLIEPPEPGRPHPKLTVLGQYLKISDPPACGVEG